MAKRRAADQISKDRFPDSNSSSEEEQESGHVAPEVLAKRKIAVPRTRLHKPASSLPAAPGANPFSTLGHAEKPIPSPLNPFGFLSKSSSPAAETATKETSTTTTNGTHSSKELRMRGLNASFSKQISKAYEVSPFEDWTSMCEKYIKYAKEVLGAPEKSTAGLQFPSFKPKPEEKSSEPESSKPAASKITPTGFSFGGSTSTQASTFKFGDKTVDIKPDTTSKSTGGFVFNPNGSGEIKLGNDTSSKRDEDSYTSAMDISNSKDEDDSKPKPKFTFSFNKDSGAAAASSNSTTDPEKPKFSFNIAPKSSQQDEDKPSSDKPAPVFNFGSTASTTSQSSGQAKPFQFGSAAAASSEKPAFTFGSSTSSSAVKPFTFGSQETSTESESGTNSNAAPKFTFGNASADKPAAAAPKFDFSGSKPSTGFSFGSGSNPFSTAAPASGAPAKKSDNTWQAGSAINITTVPATQASTEKDTTTAESGDGPSDEQTDPQTDLGGPGPGEENEDSVYEKKSKIHELVDGNYNSLGLGLLRVLVHKESKKARVLVRAEGSGRILLNVPVRKEFSYAVVGKGQVRLFDVKPGSEQPSVYILRVKTEEDAENLKNKLEEVKS